MAPLAVSAGAGRPRGGPGAHRGADAHHRRVRRRPGRRPAARRAAAQPRAAPAGHRRVPRCPRAGSGRGGGAGRERGLRDDPQELSRQGVRPRTAPRGRSGSPPAPSRRRRRGRSDRRYRSATVSSRRLWAPDRDATTRGDDDCSDWGAGSAGRRRRAWAGRWARRWRRCWSTASIGQAVRVLDQPAARPPAAVPAAGAVADSLGGLPMAWVANTGQTDAEVRYLAQGLGYATFLTDTEAVVRLDDAVVRLGFEGASTAPTLRTAEPLAATVSSFTGSDRAAWQSAAPTAEVVRYEDLWPGIDATFRGTGTHLEWDYHVAAGADPSTARDHRCRRPTTSPSMATARPSPAAGGELTLTIPAVWQTLPGRHPSRPACELGPRWRHAAASSLRTGTHAFPASSTRPSTGPPTSAAAPVANGDDRGCRHRDRRRRERVRDRKHGVGRLPDHPRRLRTRPGPVAGALVFVAKVAPDGGCCTPRCWRGRGWTRLPLALRASPWTQRATPSSPGRPTATRSPRPRVRTTRPTTAASRRLRHEARPHWQLPRVQHPGRRERVRRTSGVDVAVDGLGAAYFTGETSDHTTDYPTTPGAYRTTFTSVGSYGYVTKLDPAGGSLAYSTYLGPSDMRGIAVDSVGSAYVVGDVGPGYPTTPGAFDTTHNGNTDNAITKIDPSGSSLAYSTYVGGGGFDSVESSRSTVPATRTSPGTRSMWPATTRPRRAPSTRRTTGPTTSTSHS